MAIDDSRARRGKTTAKTDAIPVQMWGVSIGMQEPNDLAGKIDELAYTVKARTLRASAHNEAQRQASLMLNAGQVSDITNPGKTIRLTDVGMIDSTEDLG